MTDPVADELSQLADATRGATEPASEQDLAAAVQGASGIGVTDADVDQLKAMIAEIAGRLDKAEAERRAAAPPALVSTVQSLVGFLEGHGDPAAVELGKDALEAAQSATESGDTGPLAAIAAKLERHLRRNPPAPGENYHYRQAADWSANHVPDAIDSFVPASPGAAALASLRAPAKVVSGSVVG